MQSRKTMSMFTICMMTVAAVVSLRGLPMMAKGRALHDFLHSLRHHHVSDPRLSCGGRNWGEPSAVRGVGVYTWVKEAFGSRWGFTAIWLQWDPKRGVVPHGTGLRRPAPWPISL